MRLKKELSIRGDKLRQAIVWFAWARHHLTPNPTGRPAPSTGFVDRDRVTALVERFDISARIYAKIDLWTDVGDIIAATPWAQQTDFSLSALLTRLAVTTADAETHLRGFIRFLAAIACGELSTAELWDTPPA